MYDILVIVVEIVPITKGTRGSDTIYLYVLRAVLILQLWWLTSNWSNLLADKILDESAKTNNILLTSNFKIKKQIYKIFTWHLQYSNKVFRESSNNNILSDYRVGTPGSLSFGLQ